DMSENRLLVLPKLGLTMTEGAVLEWSLTPGESFKAGDILFIVESDKAAVEFEAPSAGVLNEILVEPGRTVPVGTEIGRWTLEGHSAPEPSSERGKTSESATAAAEHEGAKSVATAPALGASAPQA